EILAEWVTFDFNSANGSRVFVTLCELRAKDETILAPAAEYRRCRRVLARENFGDFPGSRKTRVINFVVLPALGGKRPSAVGESSPAIIRPQTTPAVMKKSKLSQTTVRRRARSSGQELPERPPAKQQRYPDSGSEDGPGGGDSSGGQFSDRPTGGYGSQTRVLVHLRARSTTFLAG
ncbi:hypothetical protein HID58_061783, partial [Brassica napus]